MQPGTQALNSKVRTSWWVFVVTLFCVTSGVGQVSVGDYTKLNLSGYLGFGYNGGWDNRGSNHSTSFVGDANLSGYYYHPSFLSFNVRPYYNRNQANAVSQNITNTSGFDSAVNFFTGSHFPGSVGFSKAYNGSGEIGIPGTGVFSTDGSAQNFNITWSALLPNWPTFIVNFTDYSNSSTVVGATSDSKFDGRTLNLSSTYRLAGFQLYGFFNHQNFNLEQPNLITPISTSFGNSSNSFGLSANHKLPLSGSFNASWTRSNYASEQDVAGGSTYDNVNLLTTIVPTRKLTLTNNIIFVNNLTGILQQTLIDGGVFAPIPTDMSSRSVAVNTQAFYTLGHGFGLQGYLNHREQYFRGVHLSDTLYGGIVNYRYARPLFGLLYFNFGMFDTANQEGNSSLSFVGNVGLNKKWGRWDASADFSYAQNVQTLISLYTTSNLSYGGYVRRRIGLDWSWQASFRASHSALTQHPDDSNRSETATTGFSWRRYTITGNYSQSKGASVLSAAGTLVPTPIGDIFTRDVLFFNGRSYGVSLAATPFRRFTITGYYSNLRSETLTNSLFSFNSGSRYNVLAQYEFRRLQFRGGYTHTQQNISATSALPAVVNSYFFNIARWFSIF